tara:strand:- start:16 stop:717 length:702 start_codon:yes stop_codon:yes gene_type:complete
MTISRINVGNIANDGTGDDLRQAFVKVNNNFDELDARVVPQNNAVNLGSGTGVFYTKEATTLNFRSLVAGDNMSLTADGTSITITNNGNITVRTDGSTLSLTGAGRQFGINGGQNIDTSLVGSNVTVAINATDLIFQDKNPSLGAALNGNTFNINNLGILTATAVNATTITGALTGTVNGIDVEELDRIVSGADYGLISDNITTSIELLFRATIIDYGSIVASGSLVSDYGSI